MRLDSPFILRILFCLLLCQLGWISVVQVDVALQFACHMLSLVGIAEGKWTVMVIQCPVTQKKRTEKGLERLSLEGEERLHLIHGSVALRAKEAGHQLLRRFLHWFVSCQEISSFG